MAVAQAHRQYLAMGNFNLIVPKTFLRETKWCKAYPDSAEDLEVLDRCLRVHYKAH